MGVGNVFQNEHASPPCAFEFLKFLAPIMIFKYSSLSYASTAESSATVTVQVLSLIWCLSFSITEGARIMPRIENDIKLDFKDVLIRPKRSTLKSRSQVELERTFVFKHSKLEWTGVPIMAANM